MREAATKGGVQFEDSAFGTWCTVGDDLAIYPVPAMREAEVAPVAALLQRGGASSGDGNDSFRDSADSVADLSKTVPVEMTQHCRTEYERIVKRGDARLLDLVDKTLGDLGTGRYLGKKLTENLKGERSVALYGSYRIIYRIQKSPSAKVVVLSIGHRSGVYDKQARRPMPAKSVPP